MKLKFVRNFRIGLIAVLISILVIFLLTGVGETDVRAASAEQPQQEKPKGGEKEPVEEMRVYLCPLPGGMEAPIPVYRKRAVKYITEADIVAEIDRVDVSQQHLPNGEADRMEWTYHIKNLRKGTLPPGVTAFCLSLSPQEKHCEGRASFDGRGWLRVKHNQLSGEVDSKGRLRILPDWIYEEFNFAYGHDVDRLIDQLLPPDGAEADKPNAPSESNTEADNGNMGGEKIGTQDDNEEEKLIWTYPNLLVNPCACYYFNDDIPGLRNHISNSKAIIEVDRIVFTEKFIPETKERITEYEFHIKNVRKGLFPANATACYVTWKSSDQYEGRSSYEGKYWLLLENGANGKEVDADGRVRVSLRGIGDLIYGYETDALIEKLLTQQEISSEEKLPETPRGHRECSSAHAE